jgi:hypothetical protein
MKKQGEFLELGSSGGCSKSDASKKAAHLTNNILPEHTMATPRV